MSMQVGGAYRPVEVMVSSQVGAMEEVNASAAAHTATEVGNVDLSLLRDSFDISLRSAINTMLAANPVVKELSSEERTQMINFLEFSLKQGIGVSSLIKIIQQNR